MIGKLTIKGSPYQAGLAQSLSANKPNALPKEQAAAQDTKAPETIKERFSAVMHDRLARTQGIASANPYEKASRPDPQKLVDSLDSFMNDIERSFGQAAADLVREKILESTKTGLNYESLTGAVSSAVSGLKGLDGTGQKMAALAERANRDLPKIFNRAEADQVLKDGGSLSFSYAVGSFFDRLPLPDPKSNSFSADGLLADGSWGPVNVAKPLEHDEEAEQAAENRRAVSNAIYAPAGDLNPNTVKGLSSFLKDDLKDEDAAAYLDKILDGLAESKDAYSPAFMETVTKLYAKGAATLSDKALKRFDDYINGTLKEAINKDLEAAAPDQKNQVEFKQWYGLQNDGRTFGFIWGIKGDSSFDMAVVKDALSIDISDIGPKEGKEALLDKKEAENADDDLKTADKSDDLEEALSQAALPAAYSARWCKINYRERSTDLGCNNPFQAVARLIK